MRNPSITATLIALAGSGCAVPEAPGDLVGKYAISSALVGNTCGESALPVADTLDYRAELRADGTNAYWLVGSPPARQGHVSRSGEYVFELLQTYPVREGSEPVDPVLAEMDPIALYGFDPFDDEVSDPERPETAPCTLLIAESVHASVNRSALESDAAIDDDSSDADADLVGENAIEMRASTGSDCRRVLATSGGPFERLPCAATYELFGTLLDDD